MPYIALYRKWRPKTFDDVVEQVHIVQTLKNSVLYEKVAHAYLFYGTRGTGKTSLARIFARAVNCKNSNDGNPCNDCQECKSILTGSSLDIVEIDAASNNSVDNIRELRDDTAYLPTHLKYKVYIIDEVHMLSSGAFNALLKILEEPPKHVIFILATTEPHKLPQTILSRCQKFEFMRISPQGIVDNLKYITVESNIDVHEDVLKLIVSMSDGAMRDAISMLDQCICVDNKQVTYKDALAILGLPSHYDIADLVDAIYKRDEQKALSLVDNFISKGKEAGQLIIGMISYYRAILVYNLSNDSDNLIGFSKEIIHRIQQQAKVIDSKDITNIINELCNVEQALKWSNYQKILIEVSVIKLCQMETHSVVQEVMTRLNELENKIELLQQGGIAIVQPISEMQKNEIELNSQIVNDIKDKKSKASLTKNKSSSDVKDKIPHDKIKNLDSIPEWKDILDQLKKDGKITLYVNLIDAKLVQTKENLMALVFADSHRFNYLFASRAENLLHIESAVCVKTGKDVNIRCVLLDDDIDSTTSQDQLLEKTKDIVDKFNISFNIIDE